MDLTALLERNDVIGFLAFILLAGLSVALRYLSVKPKSAAKGSEDFSQENGEKLDRVIRKVDDIEGRLTRVESDVEHLPKRDELHEMALKLAALQEKVTAIDRTGQATSAGVGRIEDFLISLSKTGGK